MLAYFRRIENDFAHAKIPRIVAKIKRKTSNPFHVFNVSLLFQGNGVGIFFEILTSPVAMAIAHTLTGNARINSSVVTLDSFKKWAPDHN